MRNQRLARVALIGTITVAVSFPALTQLLRAQAAPAPRPAAAPAAAPAAPASGSAPAATAAATQPAGAAAATQPAKVDPNKVILQVGDEKLTAAEFDAYVSDLPAQNQALVRSQRKREFAELIIETKLLAHEAEKRKLQDDPKVKRQAEFVRQQVLANALAHDVQQQVDEAAIKKFFDEHKASLERVAARHILIRTAGSKVPIRPGQPPSRSMPPARRCTTARPRPRPTTSSSASRPARTSRRLPGPSRTTPAAPPRAATSAASPAGGWSRRSSRPRLR